MNLSCKVIEDLLPLYVDGVCSKESAEAVEAHLSQCAACRGALTALQNANDVAKAENVVTEERQAEALRRVKRRIARRQVWAAVGAVAAMAVLTLGGIGVLKHTVEPVDKEAVSVSMVDGALVGRLQGSREHSVRIKRVTETVNGEEKSYLFFSVTETKWDGLTTHSDVFSEYVLCPADKGASEIAGVYYREGDDTGLENKSGVEIQTELEQSRLLWSGESFGESTKVS